MFVIGDAHFHRHVTLSVCTASDSAALISNLLQKPTSKNSTWTEEDSLLIHKFCQEWLL